MDVTSYLLGKKAGGGGSTPTLQSKDVTITSNGTQTVTPDSGYDGLSDVDITTDVQPTLQNKNVTINSNTTTSISADSNYDGLDTVSVTTNVQPDLESKSVTITENTTTTITPTSGKDGLSSVSVTTNVSGGGGIITGDIVSKEIANGSISSGDFVTGNVLTIEDRLNNSLNYSLPYNVNGVNMNNLLDNDDNTYATITGSTVNSRIYMNCKTYSQLNIPSNAKIISFKIKYKVDFADKNAGVLKIVNPLYYYGGFPNGDRDMFGYKNDRYTDITTDYPKTGEIELADFIKIIPSMIENLGFQIYTAVNKSIYLYYAKFEITYIDDSKIKKIEASEEDILGIANENGTAGDTIQVYVPEYEASQA